MYHVEQMVTLQNVHRLISIYISFIVDVSLLYFGLPHLWTGLALECTSISSKDH